jgi:hypothetical protein
MPELIFAECLGRYLSNRLTTVRRLELAKIAADETIRSLFAHGMYEFYIKMARLMSPLSTRDWISLRS